MHACTWYLIAQHAPLNMCLFDPPPPRFKGLFSWEPSPAQQLEHLKSSPQQEPKKELEAQQKVDTVLETLYGKNSEKGQMERLLYMLAGTLVFEFALETVPQLMVQGFNNSARDSWTAFTIMSFAISLGVGLDTVYRIGNDVRPLAHCTSAFLPAFFFLTK